MTSDLQFAHELAASTGDLLVALRQRIGFADRFALMDAGDRAAQVHIAGELAKYRPHDAILSEEAPDSTARLNADRVWIIDPVDGTSAFGFERSTEWAVHVALWERGHIVVGVVGRPATGEIFDTGTAAIKPKLHQDLRIVCSRSRATRFVHAVSADLGARTIDMSSAGIKTLAVLNGEADGYVHSGGQHQWDNAAPIAIAAAAGLYAARIDGTKITYNERSTLIADLVVCRPEITEQLTAAIRRNIALA